MSYPYGYGGGAGIPQLRRIRTATGKILELSPVQMQGFIYSRSYRCWIRRIA